jgi:hypothetical protein
MLTPFRPLLYFFASSKEQQELSVHWGKMVFSVHTAAINNWGIMIFVNRQLLRAT